MLEVVHIMAEQKSESMTGSYQADIHPDPPATNCLQPGPTSYMAHNLSKQYRLPENRCSMHESVWGISDSDHNTAQLALLPSGHLEHLDLDLVGSLIVLMDSTVDATCLIHVNNRRRWAFCWDVSICPASWF